MSTIELAEVSVSFGAQPTLDDLTFTIDPGSWVSIIGPNGAGKTTLLRALVGLLPYEGTIAVDGRDVRTMRRRELARALAYVSQTPELPPGMSVFDYVMLGRTPHRSYLGTSRAADLEVIRDVLVLLDLERLADRSVDSISGGEAQRAAIGRAVAQQAPVLLLDEPTSSLDIARQQEVMNMVDGLRRSEQFTVISTMHDLTLAGQYADRLMLLAGGTIQAEGAPREVLTPETIERHYGGYVRVMEDESGTITVVPLRGKQVGEAAELDGRQPPAWRFPRS